MKLITLVFIYAVIAIALTLLTAACAPKAIAVPVQIPVGVHCPSPLIPPLPYLPVQDLKNGDVAPKVMKAMVVSLKIYKIYSDELRTILEGYQ